MVAKTVSKCFDQSERKHPSKSSLERDLEAENIQRRTCRDPVCFGFPAVQKQGIQ